MISLLAAALAGQVNGNLQQIGDKKVLQVWGSHYERGLAQGYYLGEGVREVFQDFYYTMYTMSSPTVYDAMWNYYQEHFVQDSRVLSEAGGLIAGMIEAGTSTYHSGLQRNLDANDIMLMNAFMDMVLVRERYTGTRLQLGCSSLSSWGVSTHQDSLLAGNSVLTRFLDWTQNTALFANPVLVVHHPAEQNEQEWLSFTYPGLLGAVSAISANGTSAFVNTGNDNYAIDISNLDPILFAVRRGIEHYDLDGNGNSNSLDIYAAVDAGTQLASSIVHCLSENASGRVPVVVETNNSATVLRYYDNNGNLPGENLAATNHFRVLNNPTCCDRYNNIQDSLAVSHEVSAKRQWRIMSGAAGLETTLQALQYVPSTGNLLWASAVLGIPAYQTPAITLNANDLFAYSVPNQDEAVPPALPSLNLYPNPARSKGTLSLSGGFDITGLKLYNLRGQLLLDRKLAQGVRQVSQELPSLPSGVYLLRATGDKGLQAQRRLVVVP
jgi:hypothetical protein